MMFTEQLAVAIVKGEKTQTRRLPSSSERAMWREQKPWRYPVGQRFTVNPGRGVERVAEAEVTGRRMATLGEMTVDEGRAEGFPATAKAGFIDAWQRINGSWSVDTRVHVVEFKRVGTDCPSCHGTGRQPWQPLANMQTTRSCFDCYGTGLIISPAAVALIAKVEREGG